MSFLLLVQIVPCSQHLHEYLSHIHEMSYSIWGCAKLLNKLIPKVCWIWTADSSIFYIRNLPVVLVVFYVCSSGLLYDDCLVFVLCLQFHTIRWRRLKFEEQRRSLQKHSYDVLRLQWKERMWKVKENVSYTLRQLLTLKISIEYSMTAGTSSCDGIWRTTIFSSCWQYTRHPGIFYCRSRK